MFQELFTRKTLLAISQELDFSYNFSYNQLPPVIKNEYFK